MQDTNIIMNKNITLDDGTELEGYKAWVCAMLLKSSFFKEQNLTIAYNVPIWKVAYKRDDGKFQSFDELMEEYCPDKRKRFDLVVCHESDVLVVISFDLDSTKNTTIRLPILTLNADRLSEETIKMIVEWISNKIATREQSKYLYCPARNRKNKRIPLKKRIDIVKDEWLIS